MKTNRGVAATELPAQLKQLSASFHPSESGPNDGNQSGVCLQLQLTNTNAGYRWFPKGRQIAEITSARTSRSCRLKEKTHGELFCPSAITLPADYVELVCVSQIVSFSFKSKLKGDINYTPGCERADLKIAVWIAVGATGWSKVTQRTLMSS